MKERDQYFGILHVSVRNILNTLHMHDKKILTPYKFCSVYTYKPLQFSYLLGTTRAIKCHFLRIHLRL